MENMKKAVFGTNSCFALAQISPEILVIQVKYFQKVLIIGEGMFITNKIPNNKFCSVPAASSIMAEFIEKFFPKKCVIE